MAFDDGGGEKLYTSFGFGNELTVSMWRWDGHRWEMINTGLPTDPSPHAMRLLWLLRLREASGERLYAMAGFQNGDRAAFRWNGVSWEAMPALFHNRYNFPLLTADLGSGEAVYGITIPQVGQPGRFARWDGTGWTVLTSQSTWGPYYIEVDRSIVPNRVTGVGGIINGGGGVLEWAGDHWDPVIPYPPGLAGIRAATVFDDGTGPTYYIGGDPPLNQPLHCLYRWNGSEWLPAGEVGGVFGSFTGYISALQVFDDGRGPALYAGGYLNSAGGLYAPGIARWSGEAWEPLGTGVRGPSFGPSAMAVYDDGRGPSLFVTGGFTAAGAGQVCYLAQWVGCTGQCYADCTNDRRLNVLDFNCFLNGYTAQNPYADANGDGSLSVMDFLTFIDRFAAGCRD